MFKLIKSYFWSGSKSRCYADSKGDKKSVNYTLTNNLTASDKVYLEFKAPSHFEGWIE